MAGKVETWWRLGLLATQGVFSAIFVLAHFAVAQEASTARTLTLMQFEGAAPFSYRVLVPSIIHAVSSFIDATPHRLMQGVLILAVWLALVAFARLLKSYGIPAWWSLALLWPMTFNYVLLGDYITPWDIPAIALYVIGLVLIAERRWSFLPAFIVLATFNRETALMIPLAFAALTLGDIDKREWLARSMVYIGVWAAAKVAAMLLMPGMGKSAEQFDPGYNLWAMTHLAWWWPLAVFGGMHIATLTGLPRVDRKFKRLAFTSVPLLVILFFTSGYDEERIFNEIVPIVTLTSLVAIKQNKRANRAEL